MKFAREKIIEDIRVYLRFKVPASMKNDMHRVECIVTRENLCMSKCGCKAGGNGCKK